MSTYNNQPHLFATTCNTVIHPKWRVLGLNTCRACSSTSSLRHERHDVASCTEKRYTHTDTFDRSIDVWVWNPTAVTCPHNCDYKMLKPIEEYLGRWYRSSKWHLHGIITRQAAGAYFTSSQHKASFALLKKKSYCTTTMECQHRKWKEERPQKETRLPAYSK